MHRVDIPNSHVVQSSIAYSSNDNLVRNKKEPSQALCIQRNTGLRRWYRGRIQYGDDNMIKKKSPKFYILSRNTCMESVPTNIFKHEIQDDIEKWELERDTVGPLAAYLSFLLFPSGHHGAY